MRSAPPPRVGRLHHYRLPILSAILLNLTFYPWRQEWLIWMALAPLLAWLSDPTITRSQIFKGVLFVGAVYHFTLLAPFLSIGWWGWGATSEQGLRDYFTSARVFLVICVTLVAIWGGVVLGGLGTLFRPFLSRPLAAVWVVPSLWVVLLEYVGHRTVFGFGWGLIGNRLHGQELLRQVASLAGVYGLSFLVVMVNVCLACWIAAPRDTGKKGWGVVALATVMTLLVIGGAVAYGRGRLQQGVAGSPTLDVALLQGARAEYTVDDFAPDGLDTLYGRLIDEAMARSPQLVVLPETVWFKTLQLDQTSAPWATELVPVQPMQQALSRRLQGRRCVLVFGIDAVRGGRTYNTTTFWTPDGLIGVYAKQRLVPFSEYRPALLGRWAPQNVIHGPQFTFTPGSGVQLIRVNGLAIGSFICQEVMFPDLVRRSTRAGAELLVTTGNDGVFRSPVVAQEQANLAQLRAVENGRFLLRAMKTGVSAVIDPQGRILASAPLNTQTIVYGQVRPRTELTWYTRFGDWIVWLCGLIVACALLPRLRRS